MNMALYNAEDVNGPSPSESVVNAALQDSNNDTDSAINLLRDCGRWLGTKQFRDAVFCLLADRGIRHAIGPLRAYFTIAGHEIAYKAFHYDCIVTGGKVADKFAECLTGNMPIVWRALPEADGLGNFYLRFAQITDEQFDEVTSEGYWHGPAYVSAEAPPA